MHRNAAVELVFKITCAPLAAISTTRFPLLSLLFKCIEVTLNQEPSLCAERNVQPILIFPLLRSFLAYCSTTSTTMSFWPQKFAEVIQIWGFFTSRHSHLMTPSTSILPLTQSRSKFEREHLASRPQTRLFSHSSPLTASQKVTLFIVFGSNLTNQRRLHHASFSKRKTVLLHCLWD